MTSPKDLPLLVGEVFVDFTLTEPGIENKLRLGGVAHAARGFWALDIPFSAAVVIPDYLEERARHYFKEFGCVDFHILGSVKGAPNVIVIVDPTEVADQQYETLLRDEKSVELKGLDLSSTLHKDILLFPGSYDLASVCAALPNSASLHLDVAYDLSDPDLLLGLPQTISTVLISTSSPLFERMGGSLEKLVAAFAKSNPEALILKENRGGSRMATESGTKVSTFPALLGVTVNSVGVGDVFAAAYVAKYRQGTLEAGWRATYTAAAYSQTTFPDLFKTYVQRDLALDLETMQMLKGASLPWELRQNFSIYLAAPDFHNAERQAIDKAIESLRYHNFNVRRPVIENGEIPPNSDLVTLQSTFGSDYKLLRECVLVFAVPTGRDPGTLVEIGIAIEAKIPVVVYDPKREAGNTMVIAGAHHYSTDLDSCLCAVFTLLTGIADQ